ncbi:Alpha carbonic anhydrase domain [Dillenia turbinata]|uniref:Carbonic anhydrase n=1 Tax=Dillenia turbinata TaxID=194707 RepID=A0AAN8ZM62_9MAGN
MAAWVAFYLGFALGLGNIFASSVEADTVQFGYSGSLGPDHWGSLSPLFETCSTGKSQSPVNIVKDEADRNKNSKPLTRYYQATQATLVNNGFNVAVNYESDAGWLIVEGKNYSLVQMHWHTPSEHTIDGERYALEAHLVHKSTEADITVVSILFQYGDADPVLTRLQESLKRLAEESAQDVQAPISLGVIDTSPLRRKTRKYYRYVGSGTTPPCSENVIWTVLGKVRTISKEQVAALHAPLKGDFQHNSRPTQPLNGRKIELYNKLKN